MVTTSRRSVVVHSAVAFALAYLLTIVVHEFAHGLMALALGLQPVVHGSYESDPVSSGAKAALIAAAGPVVSLLVGLALLRLNPRAPDGVRLPLLWGGLLGVETFVGYLLTAPFAATGDIGRLLTLAGAPAVAAWLVFAVGLAGYLLLGRLAAAQFLPVTQSGSPDRMGELRAVGLLSWLGGTVLVLVLMFPPPYLLLVVAVVTAGLFTMLIRPFLARLGERPGRSLRLGSIWPSAAALVVVVLLIRIVLDPGVRL